MDFKINKENVHNILFYDPIEGSAWWKHRSRSLFKREQDYKRWNNMWEGKKCGYVGDGGYTKLCIFHKRFYLHRIAYVYMVGDIPAGYEVHHKDENPSNNKWENLELLTTSDHKLTIGVKKNNTSGVVGVCWDKVHNKWIVRFKNKHLGYFSHKQEAIKIRKQAEKEYYNTNGKN